MQGYKTATKNLETKFSSNLETLNLQTCNLETLNLQTCNDIKLQLPNLEKKLHR